MWTRLLTITSLMRYNVLLLRGEKVSTYETTANSENDSCIREYEDTTKESSLQLTSETALITYQLTVLCLYQQITQTCFSKVKAYAAGLACICTVAYVFIAKIFGWSQ